MIDNHGMEPYVPAERLRPFVEEWIAAFEAEHPFEHHREGGAGAPSTGAQELTRLSGVSERALRSLLRGYGLSVRFDTADRLLCAIGRVDLWHSELADIYHADETGVMAA